MTGCICHMDGNWLFFEEDSDEGLIVDSMDLSDMQVLLDDTWVPAVWLSEGIVKTSAIELMLTESHSLKIRRRLPFAFEQLLKSFDDDTLIKFANELNNLGFSFYDCIYSYNHLLFESRKLKTACTSFYQFDNEESICGVQHHRMPAREVSDRYEFTTSLGKRSILLLKKSS